MLIQQSGPLVLWKHKTRLLTGGFGSGLLSQRCCQIPALILSVISFFSSDGYARFHPQDQTEIDQEALMNSEFYNDLYSYRFPYDWEESWQSVRIGYRSNYGSLDIRRFHMTEEIRLRFLDAGKAGFSFRQERVESVNQFDFNQEIRISLPLGSWAHLSFLGDGGTFKKWRDLGFALSYGLPEQNNWLDLSFWSVDHYYNTKTEHSEDQYRRKPYTMALRGRWIWPSALHLNVSAEYDSPTVRIDGTHYQNYEYAAWQLTGDLRLPYVRKELFAGMFLSTAAKQEGRQLSLSKENWLQELYLYEKSMDRRSRQIEVYLLRDPKTAQDLWKISLAFIHRYADYFWLKDMSADIVSDNSPKTEEKESHDSNRKEWILAAQYSPLSSGPYQLLGGFFYNRIAWKDDQSLHKGELKLQTALILQMAEAAKLLLNITWDIDEIYRERQQRFRPWGGGNIQIQAGF